VRCRAASYGVRTVPVRCPFGARLVPYGTRSVVRSVRPVVSVRCPVRTGRTNRPPLLEPGVPYVPGSVSLSVFAKVAFTRFARRDEPLPTETGDDFNEKLLSCARHRLFVDLV
jgi:hypothetical protein